MATTELVIYEYKSNTNDFVKNIDKAKNSEDRMSRSTDVLDGKASKLGNTFTLVAGATGIALGVLSGAIFKTGLEFNAMQESTHKALTVLLESESAASDLEGELKKLADSSQFDLSAINGLGIALVNAGIGAEDVPGKVNDIADAVGALGGGTSELESVTRAIGQMYAKGKIQAQEMNQLAEAGIPAWKLLSESMGLSVAEVMKLGEEGKLTTDEIDLLVKAMGEKYEGGAAIDTFPEKLSNMKAQFSEFSGVIMQVFTPALTQAVEKLTIFFDAFDDGIPPEIITALKNVAIVIGLIALSVAAWSFAQLLLRGSLVQATKAIILQGVAWAIASWPVVLLSMAILALGLAFIYAYTRSEELRLIVSKTFEIIGIVFMFLMKVMIAGFGIMVKFLKKMWSLFGDELTAVFKFAFIVIGAILLLFVVLLKAVIFTCQFFWEMFGESITFIFKTAFDGIQSILNIFQGFFKFVMGILTGDWGLMSEGLRMIWTGLCDFLISIFKTLFIGPIKLILDIFGIDWQTACDFMKSIWESFTSGITSLFNGFKNIFDSVVAGIQNGWQKMTDFMMMLWDNSIGKMIEGIQNLASFAGDALSKIPFVGGLFGGKSSLNVSNGFSKVPSGNSGNSNTTNNYNFEVKSTDVKSMRQAYRSGRAMVLSDGRTL
jgi:tape measure domain-containing protein